MRLEDQTADSPQQDIEDWFEPIDFNFGLSRRGFVQLLGAGLVIAATVRPTLAQRQGGRNAPRAIPLDARIHIGKDGTITVLSGKVEGGQGARAQLTQVAAEELHVDPRRIRMILADTELCPDDGSTVGSRTTPATVPAVRQACAAARGLLLDLAARKWNAPRDSISIRDGAAAGASADQKLTYADLATESADALKQNAPADVLVTPVEQWQKMGTDLPRPNGRDIVTGAHQYPSDIIREGMLYGKILRPPRYGAKLTSIDLAPANAMDGVKAVQDGTFVAVAAPTTYLAKKALRAIEATARWETSDHPSSKTLYSYLRERARGGMPANPFAEQVKSAAKSLRAEYAIAYVQHVPMEPRAAVAEWNDGKLTVWTASQNPFGVRRELTNALRIDPQQVRVIIPDFGGGFGGKHTGETAVEAARLAQLTGKPVAVRWTREEEFTWAYFRPAAAINAEASLDENGNLSSWHFVNVNSGPSAIETPYRVSQNRSQFVQSEPPLRHGSYRALAAVANTFARECFMDELALAAERDPLAFRLAHLENPRLRAVLEEVAKRADFAARFANRSEAHVGIGIACGTEKGSFMASCAEVKIDPVDRTITVRKLWGVFECGAVINPRNTLAQVHGGMIQALGPALQEAIEFEEGRIQNASLWKYTVPRMKALPQLDIHLLDRPDLPSVGSGETPLIAVAPAIANAVHHATGARLRKLPLRWA